MTISSVDYISIICSQIRVRNGINWICAFVALSRMFRLGKKCVCMDMDVGKETIFLLTEKHVFVLTFLEM